MFLGIDIQFIDGNEVKVSMPHHVDKDLEELGDILKGKVVNHVTSQLFTIISETKEFDDEIKERYHLINTKILWIMKISRPDLETSVSFICTRLQNPNRRILEET